MLGSALSLLTYYGFRTFRFAPNRDPGLIGRVPIYISCLALAAGGSLLDAILQAGRTRYARRTSTRQFPRAYRDFRRRRLQTSRRFAVCARPGLLDAPINLGRMTHFIRDTDYGCEMRSRFWLGDISHRDPTVDHSRGGGSAKAGAKSDAGFCAPAA